MLKYLFDRIVSLIGLLIIWPVMLVIAILIKVKMPDGPVIFRQKRVGKNGKLFTCHKFRTMADDSYNSSVTLMDEAPITPLGTRLRRYHLDELPQLWDVFIGKMSFVGPRPDVPGYADMLQGDNRDMLRLRPGITGPATLKYRDEEEMIAEYVAQQQAQGDTRHALDIAVEYNDKVLFPDKVRLNCYYYRNYSFRTDIKIILATVFGKKITYAGEEI